MTREPHPSIPNACDVDYESMAERDGTSRTCERCKTTVYDLAAMDPGAAERILERARREKICARANVDGRSRILKRGLAVLAPALVAACSQTQNVGQVVMGKVEPTATEADATSSAASSSPIPVPTTHPRAWDITKGSVQLHVIDKPGTIVDSTAPPPLPNQPLAQHPFVSGSCFGDPLGCSQAGDILRKSTSTNDYISRLQSAGYTVKPAQQ